MTHRKDFLGLSISIRARILLSISLLILFVSPVSAQNATFERVVIILVDGSRLDGMYGNPNPGLGYLVEHGVTFTDTKSTFPTITPSAHASIYTGAWPNQTGIIGFRYFIIDEIEKQNTLNKKVFT